VLNNRELQWGLGEEYIDIYEIIGLRRKKHKNGIKGIKGQGHEIRMS
jgi:hypothetical protein